jgi:putative transposase
VPLSRRSYASLGSATPTALRPTWITAEELAGDALTNLLEAEKIFGRVVRRYNEQRLHSALGFLAPVDYYRGNPNERYAARRRKLAAARHQRKEKKASAMGCV